MQGCAATLIFPRVHVRAVVDKQFHRGGATCTRGRHERRLTLAHRFRDVGAAVQQNRHRGGIAIAGGLQQRRDAKAVGGVRIGAGLQQQLHEIGRGLISGPQQGRRAVGFGDVDIVAGRQLFLDGVDIAVARRGGNAADGGGVLRCRECDERGKRSRSCSTKNSTMAALENPGVHSFSPTSRNDGELFQAKSAGSAQPLASNRFRPCPKIPLISLRMLARKPQIFSAGHGVTTNTLATPRDRNYPS